MAKQPMSRSLSWSGLSLLITMSGSVVVLLADAESWPVAVPLLGLAAFLAGMAGMCVFVYRESRSTGDGVLKSLGRTVWAAVQFFDFLP